MLSEINFFFTKSEMLIWFNGSLDTLKHTFPIFNCFGLNLLFSKSDGRGSII